MNGTRPFVTGDCHIGGKELFSGWKLEIFNFMHYVEELFGLEGLI